jgi:uncharacterized protein
VEDGRILKQRSLPGILIGSYFAHRVPEAALRRVPAATLILAAGNLANREPRSSFANIAAFAPASAR